MGKTNALSLANNTVISNDIHRLPLHENVPPIYVSTHSHSSLEALKKLPSNALPWAIDHNGHLIYKLMPKLVEISDPIINQNTLKQSYVAPEQRAQKESLIDLQHDESNIKTSRDISANVQPYTKALSKQRRRECQSVLADIALTQRQMTIAGVHKVTEGVIHYIEQAKQEGKTIEKTIAECMKKYMYSDSGFGRLDQTDKAPKEEHVLYQLCLDTLKNGSLDSVLAIHDFMGRIVFKRLGGTNEQQQIFDETGKLFALLLRLAIMMQKLNFCEVV